MQSVRGFPFLCFALRRIFFVCGISFFRRMKMNAAERIPKFGFNLESDTKSE